MPSWLWDSTADVPLFVSTRRLAKYKALHPARVPAWAVDSGGFTELAKYGGWRTAPHVYAARVRRYCDEIGRMDWASPQDWMCEPFMLDKTGLDVAEHQRRTVTSILDLRTLAPDLPFVPVLQGWTVDDYLRHVEMYDAAGIDLADEPVVGLGSVCRRQATGEAEHIVQRLQPLRLHGFGMKAAALHRFGSLLHSSDSMAWSFAGRRRPDPDCSKSTCSNCYHYAAEWRRSVLTPTRPSLFA
jgi:hypothetical protein